MKLKLLIPKWTAIHSILSGIIGKTIFIISLAVPISKLSIAGVDLEFYPITLMGAVIISICYLLEKAFIPNIVFEFMSSSKYADQMINRYEGNTLDFTGEFDLLNQYQSQETNNCEIEVNLDKLKKCLPIESGKEILGSKEAVYAFSITKFEICNVSKSSLRGVITFAVLMGFILLYYPALSATVTIIFNFVKS